MKVVLEENQVLWAPPEDLETLELLETLEALDKVEPLEHQASKEHLEMLVDPDFQVQQVNQEHQELKDQREKPVLKVDSAPLVNLDPQDHLENEDFQDCLATLAHQA